MDANTDTDPAKTDDRLGTLLEYLGQHVTFRYELGKKSDERFKFLCMEEFVLEYGMAPKPQVLPAKYPKGQIKRCFSNAYNLICAHDQLTYMEGWAWGGAVIPVVHAWAVDEHGNVIDNTWDDAQHAAYYGVPFESGWVKDTISNKQYDGIIDDWENGYPVLRHDFDNAPIKRRWW